MATPAASAIRPAVRFVGTAMPFEHGRPGIISGVAGDELHISRVVGPLDEDDVGTGQRKSQWVRCQVVSTVALARNARQSNMGG
jgi:hypothetical protein